MRKTSCHGMPTPGIPTSRSPPIQPVCAITSRDYKEILKDRFSRSNVINSCRAFEHPPLRLLCYPSSRTWYQKLATLCSRCAVMPVRATLPGSCSGVPLIIALQSTLLLLLFFKSSLVGSPAARGFDVQCRVLALACSQLPSWSS